MKYLKNFPDHNDYSAFIVGSDFKDIQREKKDIVSYCKNQSDIHYNPYITPIAKFLDILYSDINGNLSFTSEILSVSEGKTPIGLCIAGTGFFGDNEPARWMSFKYMNYETPETGSLTAQGISWGNYHTDIITIDNILTTHNGGSSSGFLTADWITNTANKIPSLYDANGNWNISVLGTVNQYAVTDIDGKNKTTKMLATATGQSNWQTDTSITNNSDTNYAPAACCCARYHTVGTQPGDWYLGACGEMSIIVVKRNEINIKLAAINAVYPNDCVSSLDNNRHWTSTECNDYYTYYVDIDTGLIYGSGKVVKGTDYYILAMLQY